MKKLFVVFLALLLLLSFSVVSYADSCIGYWYMYVDGSQYPEFMANYGNFDSVLSLYYFSESGKIFLLENDMLNESATPSFVCCGKWEKDDSSYKYSLFGIGEGTFSAIATLMKLDSPNSYSMILRRVVPFDPYKDYIN